MKKILLIIFAFVIVMNFKNIFLFAIFIIFTLLILVIMLFARVLKKLFGRSEITKKVIRPQTMTYYNGVSYHDFDRMIQKITKPIKKIKGYSITAGIVTFKVLSNSGISEWSFSLDFNDNGIFTGRHWIQTDNDDSSLPESVGQRISTLIEEELRKV